MRKVRIGMLMLALMLVLLLSTFAAAQWSGGQTITMEMDPEYGLLTIYTTVLEYELRPEWMLTAVLDRHPIYGLDMDLSATRYFRPLGKVLYSTAGMRWGLIDSQTNWAPYITITLRF